MSPAVLPARRSTLPSIARTTFLVVLRSYDVRHLFVVMPAAKPAKEEEEGSDERAGLGKSGPALRGVKRAGHKEGGPEPEIRHFNLSYKQRDSVQELLEEQKMKRLFPCLASKFAQSDDDSKGRKADDTAAPSSSASKFVQSNKDSKGRKADDIAAASLSAAPKGSNGYDMFLSFRGTDTRNTFVDHLYNNLVDAGICVFKDDDELCEGEEISTNLLAAIKNSKISIPILSQNYAWSKACLQELVQMIECMKNAGGKYSREDVAKWKEALQEVASLKGWESEKIANGREGELVRMVVRTVLSKLKEAFQLVVTEQLVGIDDTVANILRLLDDNHHSTQIVGIHGMGGIGKTTLAKVVYNKLSNQFQHRSFITDIRESSQHRGISCLQEQLIRDILGREDRVSNEDEGIRIMESKFKHKKVLLLLDDVDNHDQLKALIGKGDWFERGSRMIITTRRKSILDDANVNCHELNGMAKDQVFDLV
ncbi:disease resistance protein RUN1-like [Eucalyptus grandis]|uniref:disease resistance protein RUN1-like n=1 Tax=Eucalyptus grandis TaxID=71139 RepID=UPI00192EED1B|nr:disease resistance protein RUN1-like [Eucalyptus grandis]